MDTNSEKPCQTFGETPARIVLSVGCLVTGLAALLQLAGWTLWARFDNFVFDHFARWHADAAAAEQAVIVDIDENALSAVGQWPWPRYHVASLIKTINAADPRVVGLDILFPEQDRTSLTTLRESFRRDFDLALNFSGVPPGLEDNDGYLGAVLAESKAVGSIFFYPNLRNTEPPCVLSPVRLHGERELIAPPEGKGVLCNIPKVHAGLGGSGFINAAADADGYLRRLPMLYAYQGQLYPSFTLALLLRMADTDTVRVESDAIGPLLRVAGFSVPVDKQGAALLRFQAPAQARRRVSALDILRADAIPGDLAGKVILLGSTAVGLADRHRSAVEPNLSGTEANAVLIDNILNGAFYREPTWQLRFSLGAVLTAGLLAAVLFAYCSAVRATLGVVLLGGTFCTLSLGLFVASGVILHVTAPVSTLAVESGVLAFLLYRRHERIATASRRARDRAVAANRAKNEFFAHLSHEIRTPLHGILTAAKLLPMDRLEPREQEYAAIIRNSGETLLTMLNNMLDLSKIEAGKLDLDVSEFELPNLLDEVVRLFRVRAEAKDLQFFCRLDPETPGRIRGDARYLKQILTNLIDNAIKFTEHGEVVLTVSRRQEDAASITLLFSVSDTGIGIPPEQLDEIFAPFVQADTSRSREFGGTGLGLAISARLVELMGGKHGVVSELEQGSRFWFTAVFGAVQEARPAADISAELPAPRMPVAQGSPAENACLAERPLPARVSKHQQAAPELRDTPADMDDPHRFPRSSHRILIADDSPVNRTLMLALLRNLGYRADAVSNGLTCLEALRKGRYDLVFMDCLMPEMDGYMATRNIRAGGLGAANSTLPIIALSANAAAEEQTKCMAAGMDGYLTKPVDTEQLKQILAIYLE